MFGPSLVDLLKLLCPGGAPPWSPDLTHIVLTCISAFEANCHESWGFGWSLQLPQYQYHWQGNDGVWIEGTQKFPMTFGAKTPELCIQKAVNFLEDWNDGKHIDQNEYSRRVRTGHYRRANRKAEGDG